MNSTVTQDQVPLYDGKPLAFSLDPIKLKKADHEFIVKTLTQVLKDIEYFTEKSLKDLGLLKQLGLPQDLDPTPTPLGLHIPFARFDFLFDGQKVEVLELNTDGTSGFNVTEWISEKAQISKAQNPNFNLSMRLLETIRAHDEKAKDIVLMDYKDVKTSWEQIDLISRWKSKAECRRADPSMRTWSQGALVYRRTLSWQLRSQPEKAQAFLDDWKNKKITVVGGWSSDVGMSKAWPVFLKSKASLETYLLDEKTIKLISNEKDLWVLKGAMSFSGQSVIRGGDLSQSRWEASLKMTYDETKLGRPWIAQRRVEIPLYEGKPLELGLYFLNGVANGYLARWGSDHVISETSKEVIRPVQVI